MAFLPVIPTTTGTFYGYGAKTSAGAYGTGAYGGLNDSGCPFIEIQMDYQNDPTSTTVTWTDITPWAVSYSRSPVRANELDQPGSATAQITLRNDDYRFSPLNQSTPYGITGTFAGPGILPFRRIRVRANWNGVIYNRFFGYVAGPWQDSWDDSGKNPTVTLNLADAMAPLEVFDLQGEAFIGTRGSGVYIQQILTWAGIPTTQQNLDPGASSFPGISFGVGSYAAQAVKDAAASENGFVFAAGDGTIQFHDRDHRTTATRSTTQQALLGDTGASGEVPYNDVQMAPVDVWPIVQVTPSGGSVQQSTNTAGASAFFNRTLNWPTAGTYLVTSSTEAASAASWFSTRYGGGNVLNPNIQVSMIGTANTSQWPTILTLDTADRVRFNRALPSPALSVSTNMWVEGYGDDVKIGQDWRVPLAMSAYYPVAGY